MPKLLRSFFLILWLISFSCSFAQGPKGNGNAVINSIPTQIRHDTCLDKKFSVVVYIINDSVYSLTNPTGSLIALSTYSLPQNFAKLNALFSRWCISFEHCKTVIIPNFTYNDWNARRNGINAIAEYNTVNTICLYLPNSMLTTNMYDQPVNGYAYHADTISPYKNAIVTTRTGFAEAPFYHALGLFFGLPHTFSEINLGSPTIPPTPAGIYSMEFVNKTNSLIHGDGFSDTDADPFPSVSNPNLAPPSNLNCGKASLKDANGEYYTPPQENYMSHYTGCACKYSEQQYYSMVHYIMRKRLYLH